MQKKDGSHGRSSTILNIGELIDSFFLTDLFFASTLMSAPSCGPPGLRNLLQSSRHDDFGSGFGSCDDCCQR